MEGLWLEFVPDACKGSRQKPLLCSIRLNKFLLVNGLHVLKDTAAMLCEFQRSYLILDQEDTGLAAVFAQSRLIQQACPVGRLGKEQARNGL